MERVRAGWCDVPNPVNPRRVSRVSLAPPDVDVIVFWSKNPAPLLPFLNELDARGFRYCFLFTLNDYPRAIEPRVPDVAARIATFRALAARLGADRLAWRYDPIILSRNMPPDWHLAAFERIAAALDGCTPRTIVSIVDFYRRTRRRLAAVSAATGDVFCEDPFAEPRFEEFTRGLTSAAAEHGMAIQSCAEDPRLAALGVTPGKCIDDEFIRRAFGISVPGRKDPHQREQCGCVISRDIGVSDTCRHQCEYCYATRPAV